ncbi:hypothetical protein [uncultured Polaribacter sp.]|uniref:hypothetical protein n=1 Tax=uncultured Polaribacter sp. TaxID=174711 RepID=UPI0030D74BF9|tara:strand:- start:3727 stop:4197 length:471 start_codon:yes stop_codon:yes gene_type:complete
MRVVAVFIFVLFCTSCDKFTFSKNKNLKVVDTIVDFTRVDFSPSFKECDSLIDTSKLSDCFRNTIHQKISLELQMHSLFIKDSIDEDVFADILINAKGQIVLQEIRSTENLQTQLPQLDSVLKQSIKNLPTINPAIKRGIPVSSKYRLKLKILLKE